MTNERHPHDKVEKLTFSVVGAGEKLHLTLETRKATWAIDVTDVVPKLAEAVAAFGKAKPAQPKAED